MHRKGKYTLNVNIRIHHVLSPIIPFSGHLNFSNDIMTTIGATNVWEPPWIMGNLRNRYLTDYSLWENSSWIWLLETNQSLFPNICVTTHSYLTPRKHCKTVATPHINMVMLSSCARTSCSSTGHSSAVSINGRESEPPIHITACWNNVFISNVMYK